MRPHTTEAIYCLDKQWGRQYTIQIYVLFCLWLMGTEFWVQCCSNKLRAPNKQKKLLILD